MAKCYFTGVELPTREMLVLDVTAARRAVRDLRQRLDAVERLTEQLQAKDELEVYDVRIRKSIRIKHFRLVSRDVADALSSTYPWEKLFIVWDEFQARRKAIRSLDSRLRHVEPPKSPESDEGGAA